VRARLAPLLLVAFGLGACGSGEDAGPPDRRPPVVREVGPAERSGAPTAEEVATIRGWSDALRGGDVAAAAAYFALPARVLDGTNPLRELPSRGAVRRFNRGLPCGAKLVDTERGEGSLVVATFRLTERPGPGSCGSGTGALVRTAFLIEDRRIVQWLRIADPPPVDADES
jgi:hypothetical protein